MFAFGHPPWGTNPFRSETGFHFVERSVVEAAMMLSGVRAVEGLSGFGKMKLQLGIRSEEALKSGVVASLYIKRATRGVMNPEGAVGE